ncbi:MAG: bifunctional phosphopantothenoylcysteine decarboxylase/phosphopantothenate--cysteine ligase CoaBC [Campylobacteraceae bacterium]|nr:bifunctional phosphopantothenoylcysteine decarboxylase/phosphopantothenate--cysteine ligase CoaBC [Campylobacteraceae bacterium]
MKLKDKKILLGVCGSISFYKAFEILSKLKKLGADVYVMLSDGALNFVNYESFEALSEHRVLCSKNLDWQAGLNHIEYSKMDLVLIAPASVNTINKYARGFCDNVFIETLIATKAPIMIAPAANNNMLENEITKESIESLRKKGVTFIEPVTKTLACGDVGKGALADVDTIVNSAIRELCKDEFYAGRTVIVTGGATSEKIDDVRVISNLSSGKTSKALADAFYYLGADVVFISSYDYSVPYKLIKFDSSFGLQSALLSQNLKEGDIVVMAAAVSDFIPNKIKGKIDKESTGEVLTLNFRKNEDIISKVKTKGVKKIGFKLEVNTKDALNNAKKTLATKDLDAICLNVLNDVLTFGGDKTKISFITKDGITEIPAGTKEDSALEIAQLIKSL